MLLFNPCRLLWETRLFFASPCCQYLPFLEHSSSAHRLCPFLTVTQCDFGVGRFESRSRQWVLERRPGHPACPPQWQHHVPGCALPRPRARLILSPDPAQVLSSLTQQGWLFSEVKDSIYSVLSHSGLLLTPLSLELLRILPRLSPNSTFPWIPLLLSHFISISSLWCFRTFSNFVSINVF